MRAQAAERTGLLFMLDGALFYGMIALIVLTAIPYGTVEPWSEALFECAVFALGLLWVIHGLLAGSWKPSGLRVFLPLIALAILAIAQSVHWGQANWAG